MYSEYAENEVLYAVNCVELAELLSIQEQKYIYTNQASTWLQYTQGKT